MSALAQQVQTWRQPDAAVFRRAMGMVPTGVTLITVGGGDCTMAMTANAVMSVSLDPMLVLVSVGVTGRLRDGIEHGGGFAVNVLAEHQRELAGLFARKDRPSGRAAQELLGGGVGETGNALVREAVMTLECRTERQYPGGDHVLFLGAVEFVHVAHPRRAPLVFHQGGYTEMAR